MSLINDFKARFPEFKSSVVDTYWATIESIWPSYYGGAYTAESKELVLNLCAHLLYDETSTGPSGTQQAESRTIGIISEKFSSRSSGGSGQFDGSKYGRRFMQLARISGGAVAI
jgi:hypothetical protein